MGNAMRVLEIESVFMHKLWAAIDRPTKSYFLSHTFFSLSLAFFLRMAIDLVISRYVDCLVALSNAYAFLA